MKKTVFKSILLCVTLLLMVTSCASLCSNYTTSYKPRPDQTVWFTAEERVQAEKDVLQCVSAAEMITDYPRASRYYGIYLRRIYTLVSQQGKDVDAGIRAVNYIHHLHKKIGGSRQLWADAVSLAKQPADAEHHTDIPLPQDY